jgi:carbon-monoxide dehydrogenase small subunit
VNVALTVNGRGVEIEVAPAENLLTSLRDRLCLTGSKDACHEGSCGTCTVLLDGAPVYSCLVLSALADGSSVETIEGLTADGRARQVQEALLDAGAVQCGFCTPGLVVAAVALIERAPTVSEEEVRRALAGNLCRCTGYVRIVDAVLRVAQP